jgi:hypothetical protein
MVLPAPYCQDLDHKNSDILVCIIFIFYDFLLFSPILGILGHPLEAYIFMGPIYYQKLKHMVRIVLFVIPFYF